MENDNQPDGASNRSPGQRRMIHIPFFLILLVIYMAFNGFSNHSGNQTTPPPGSSNAGQTTAAPSTETPAPVTAAPATDTPEPVTAPPNTDTPAPSASALPDHNEWYDAGLRYYYHQQSSISLMRVR